MLTPREAKEKAETLSPEERSRIVGRLVAEKVERILEDAVLRAIASKQERVRVTLMARDCTDADKDIRDFLAGHGYTAVRVSSDFPGYNETYEGSTDIEFSIPQ